MLEIWLKRFPLRAIYEKGKYSVNCGPLEIVWELFRWRECVCLLFCGLVLAAVEEVQAMTPRIRKKFTLRSGTLQWKIWWLLSQLLHELNESVGGDL